ncbi:YhgE/Pip family protein [Nocardiopsis gilva]|uniref:YhgE/Pip family protein n=1 Tax=Nocardiopsis gilva TaxID=280236 RepID=UPI00034745B1
MAIGVAQVAVMMSTLHLTLGLDAVYWGGVIGLLVLTVASYSAVVQWATVQFGTAGRIVSLILLMLQLTSAGGTYPIETSPGFFQAIAPYLPMSHVVQALRILISGGDMGAVWTACGVLTAYLVGALLLTWFAVSRKRAWTMKDLYPALKV